MTWQLRVAVRREGAPLVELVFERSPITVGALPHNDVVLADPWVSGEHAVVHVSGGGLVYRDRSRNGSFVDGVRIAERRLGSAGLVSVPPFELGLELLGGDDTWHTEARPVVEKVVLDRSAVAGPAASPPSSPAPPASAPPAPAPPAVPPTEAAEGGANLFRTMPSAVSSSADAPRIVARLRILRGEPTLEGRTLAVPDRPTKIGRSHRADVAVPVMTVSRIHASLEPAGEGRLRVSDLDSSNGTYVNGRRVRSEELRLGDELRLGELVMRLEAAQPASEPPMTPPPAAAGSELEVEVEPGGEETVIRLGGRLESHDAPRVVAAVEKALAGGARRFVCELAALVHASDDSLASLVKVRSRVEARGGELRLSGVNEAIREALVRCRLDGFFLPRT